MRYFFSWSWPTELHRSCLTSSSIWITPCTSLFLMLLLQNALRTDCELVFIHAPYSRWWRFSESHIKADCVESLPTECAHNRAIVSDGRPSIVSASFVGHDRATCVLYDEAWNMDMVFSVQFGISFMVMHGYGQVGRW